MRNSQRAFSFVNCLAAAIVVVDQQDDNDDKQDPGAFVTAEQILQTHREIPLPVQHCMLSATAATTATTVGILRIAAVGIVIQKENDDDEQQPGAVATAKQVSQTHNS